MKILWLAHEGDISGANICLVEYLKILKEQGFESYIIVPFSSKMELAKAASKIDIKIFRVKFYPWTTPSINHTYSLKERMKRWIRNRIAIKEIVKITKGLNPDFIATNTITVPVAAFAAKKTKTKHVWFIHEFGDVDHGFVIKGGFFKAAVRMAELSYKIAFNSFAVKGKYESIVLPHKQYIVANAVVLAKVSGFKACEAGAIFKLIMLGQIAPSKNHLEAIKALKIRKANGLNFELVVVGKEQNPFFLRSLIAAVASYGLEGCVKFAGPVDEPTEILQQQDALLMCSRMEAFGRVTVEALKLGVPVIAANNGGSVEILKNGLDGYFYESGSEVDLAEKIMLLEKTYSMFNREQIAKRARERYNEENTFKQLSKVFS